MMENIRKEYYRRVRMVPKSELTAANRFEASHTCSDIQFLHHQPETERHQEFELQKEQTADQGKEAPPKG